MNLDAIADAPAFVAQFNRFELCMSLETARACSHVGRCDEDVADALRANADGLRAQIAALDPCAVRDELREYGAWEPAELADDEANARRLVWLAAGNIREEERSDD